MPINAQDPGVTIAATKRVPGAATAQAQLTDAFFEPLPEAVLQGFEAPFDARKAALDELTREAQELGLGY